MQSNPRSHNDQPGRWLQPRGPCVRQLPKPKPQRPCTRIIEEVRPGRIRELNLVNGVVRERGLSLIERLAAWLNAVQPYASRQCQPRRRRLPPARYKNRSIRKRILPKEPDFICHLRASDFR